MASMPLPMTNGNTAPGTDHSVPNVAAVAASPGRARRRVHKYRPGVRRVGKRNGSNGYVVNGTSTDGMRT
jgi:hypothetical protein